MACLPPNTCKQTSSTFHQRSVKYPKLDKTMELWVSHAIVARLPLSDQILQEKGCDFANSFNIDVASSDLNSENFIDNLPDEQRIILENYMHQLDANGGTIII
jgi:hypothetical protein